MIVPVFNYHSSIITIMGKSNKALYINIPSNFRYVLKLIQNRLNRLVFFMKTSCSFTKNNLKSFFRPGWKGM